ncbi:Sec-dependent nitrous-oxide reductase [bacterium]|nr:Sec-dependent nitrous-oxide reductase [bacterium]
MRDKERFDFGKWVWPALLAGLLIAGLFACRGAAPGGEGDRERGATGSQAGAAAATYVAPGDLDEMYLFYSGGHSGNVYVAGMPSMRHISTIPVFAKYPATGYGFDDESRKMLGGLEWGDVHHPSLSRTNGEYDGKWLFVNDAGNNRYARIDLRDFKTKQIIGPVPNCSGLHGGAFCTSNSEFLIYATRFSVPLPLGTAAPIADYAAKYKGVVGALSVNKSTGEMSYDGGFQIMTPPFNWDLGSTGRGPSADWVFFTCYNSERATGELEKTASANDRDYIIAVNWKLATELAKGPAATDIAGMKVIDPAKAPGLCFLIPCPKSPHGVDCSPDGTYFVGSGKLEAVTTVYGFQEMLDAIKNKNFTGDEDGIPVLDYDKVKLRECQIGLGPLHTQYDDKGMAYTSLFVDSAVAKWDPSTGEVLDTIPVAYNIGHLMVPGGDSAKPFGKYVVAMNKLSHGRHLNVGPSQPESSQLIDINGDKMKILYESYTEPEPHYAQAIPATMLSPVEVYPLDEIKSPYRINDVKEAGVVREGTTVHVKMLAVRSTLSPTSVEVNKGDTVTFHISNIEQTTDELHGFGLAMYNVNVVIDPGEFKEVTIVADKPGVYPYYCTNFCSALHQEMQGYLIVK